jgi:hypothetical protein
MVNIASSSERPWWLWIPLLLSWIPVIVLTLAVLFLWFYWTFILGLLEDIGGIFSEGSSTPIILLLLLLPTLATVFAYFAALRAKDAFRNNKWAATFGWCLTTYVYDNGRHFIRS